MNAVEQLIRVHRWNVEERRRCLADLEQLGRKLREDLVRLDSELARERTAATVTMESRRAFPLYAAMMGERRKCVVVSIGEVDREIARAQEQLASAFQELKRYEITLSNREAHQRQRELRREQVLSDEVGIEIFRRRSAAEN